MLTNIVLLGLLTTTPTPRVPVHGAYTLRPRIEVWSNHNDGIYSRGQGVRVYLRTDQDAFVTLRHADMIVMVIEARQSTIPVVSSALNILTTAFKKVDGIIVNRRRFEVPYSVLNLVSRLRSLA